MAQVDISSEIAAISSAVYGEEVRGSIKTALQKMVTSLNTAIGTQVIDRATVDSVLASEALSLKYSNYEEIVSATDLNVIAGDPGNYWIPYDKAQTILNIPVKQTGRLFVLPGKGTASTSDGGTQIFLSAQKGGVPDIWIRGWKGQNWKPWKKIATSEESNFLTRTVQALFSTDTMFIDLSGIEIVQGSYIKTDGTVDVNSNLSYTSDYVEIPSDTGSLTVNRVIWTPDGSEFLRTHMIWFYNASKVLLGTGTETLTDRMLTTIPPKGAKYLRANFSSDTQPFIVVNSIATELLTKTISSLFDASPMFIDLTNAEIVQGSYIQTEGDIGSNSNLSYTSDYIEIPDNTGSLTVNRIIWIPDGTEFQRTHMIWFYNASKVLLGTGTETLTDRMLTTIPPKGAKYLRANFSSDLMPFIVVNFDHNGLIDNKTGYVGEYSGTFSGSRVSRQTTIYLEANVDYVIKFNTPHLGSINFFMSGTSTPYKNAQPHVNEVHFTPSTSGYLTAYNTGGVVESFSITVCKKNSTSYKVSNEPEKYIVSKKATQADYTSITQCFLDLKDNVNPKIIEIWEGDYDLYQEYVAAGVPVYTGSNPSLDYFDYCVWVPQNSHIIGKGIVRLKWMPNPASDSITPNQCKCVSPLNVAGSAIIENLEVYCKNGRYCLHNDAVGKPEFSGARQIYRNIRFYKYANDENTTLNTTYGFAHTTGFGIDRAMHHLYENCTFVNYGDRYAFYGHTRASAISSEAESSDITCVNCAFVSGGVTAIKFGNGTSRTLHIRTMFNSCYIPAKIDSVNESVAADPCANAFDIQLLNCGNVSFRTTDTNNQYPPQAYNTQLTIV